MKKLILLSFLSLLLAGCMGKLGEVRIEGVIADSEEVVEELKKFEESPSIEGILVVVNSPGGAVAPSQEIFQAIKRIKEKGKKVVVYMSSVAASGGYYVSLPADEIVALPATITGSIGVIMNFPVYDELLDKVGVKVYTVKSREFKDIGSGLRDPTTQDTLLLKSLIEDVYNQFTEEVVHWRELSEDSVYALADGRVYSGRQAYQYGLVDTLGDKEDAHRILAERCGLEGLPKLVRIPKRSSFLEELLESRLEPLFAPSLRYQMDLM